ncbi:MAG: hypothetical protein KGI39_03200 [Patescibacteria group bacterium]|nr:hypothetical protein [Patescibacteria group bacterium]
MKNIKTGQINDFLNRLNKEYSRLHTAYENLFWLSYMGDHSVNKEMNKALSERDAFRANEELLKELNDFLAVSEKKEKKRIQAWKIFFDKYQTPKSLLSLKKKIDDIESKIRTKKSTRREGYIDPKSNKFVKSSYLEMRTTMRTNADEAVRKACFNATEGLAEDCLDEYAELVKIRNEYAKKMGYEDFYEYKAQTEEGMSKKEIFRLFYSIYDKTRYAFKNVRKLEKKMPDLRKPWNFAYMMTGDFTKEEDPFFQFDEALMRWGRSFSALGVDFQGGALKLDLLDREGKYNNGFCHWPRLVQYEKGEIIPGSANFTCNVVYGQVGSGIIGMNTLFHEGGHAAHLLNSEQPDVCLNHEYPPMSTAWAETQSQFMDTMFGSIEWKVRYARDKNGNSYPMDLFKRKMKKIHPIFPLEMMPVMFLSDFEKEIYECKNLGREKILSIAKKVFKKYFDRSEDSLFALNVPHIYSWQSACSYHGYGLAKLAISQWRNYFYKKYGYIVNNSKVGEEARKVWKLGTSATFKKFVIMAVGKKLSAEFYVKEITQGLDEIIRSAENKIKKMEKVPRYEKPVALNARISMAHGKEEICNNKISFENMAEKYKEWLKGKIKKVS